MKGNRTWDIKVEQISSHPDNPRKDLGDLSELVESIREHGILQNITVIPRACLDTPKEEQTEGNEQGEFVALLGHRRLAAYRIATGGRGTIRCNVLWELSRAEQIGLMMEENVQRNDLTIPEQVESFQLMLDLGETVESISQKTGFSKSTIYKRVKNADVIEEMKDTDYQLTVSDLDELAKVTTEQKRMILDRYNTAAGIRQGVDAAIRETEWKKRLAEAKEKLDSLGLLEWDDEATERYGQFYMQECVASFSIGSIPDNEWQGDEYYKLPDASYYDTVYVRRPQEESKGQQENEEERKAMEEKEKARKKLKDAEKRITDGINDFLRRMVKDKSYSTKDIDEEQLIRFAFGERAIIDMDDICDIVDDEEVDITEDAYEEFCGRYKPDWKMIFLASLKPASGFLNYRGEYLRERAGNMMDFMAIIEQAGYVMPTGEDWEILNGTSEIYKELEV